MSSPNEPVRLDVLITEIMTSTPVLGSRASRVTNTSTEMIPDINRDKPVNPVGQLSDTEQLIMLGVMTDKGANGPQRPSGPQCHVGRTNGNGEPAGPSGPIQWNGTVCLPQTRCRPGPLHYSKMSSPDDSYQPLVTGPSGTNGINAINNPGRPTAGGPLGRPFKLDPMGPRAMLSLGDGNQPTSVGPVGRS